MALPPLKPASFLAGGVLATTVVALCAGCSSNKSSSNWEDFQPAPAMGAAAPAVPGAVASQKPSVDHVVEQGDTLWELAMEYKTTVREIKEANSLASDMIRVGQTIKIPTDAPPAGAAPTAPAAPAQLSPAPAPPAPAPPAATVTPGAGTQVIEAVPQPQPPAQRTAPPPPSPPPPRAPSYQPDPNMGGDDFNVPSVVPGN